jgi:glycosyltransferase involved in cell wall biosynthesis
MTLISAFIITKNEEARIARAIASLKAEVDEIIVIDSGSTDRTVEIAEKLGARVVYNEWKGYTQQKVFGESLCKHKWILNIDADEVLTPSLEDEIGYIFRGKIQDRYKAYRINFIIMHRTDSSPRRFAPSNSFIRLYNRDYASFGGGHGYTTRDAVCLNEGVSEEKDVYLLNEPALHYSGTSIEQLVAKANFYSSEQAEDLARSSRKVSKLRTGLEFFLWFFKAFFIRRYFVFGFDGFVDSMIFAFARFLRLAKAKEITKTSSFRESIARKTTQKINNAK